jgi:hypothetical protein
MNSWQHRPNIIIILYRPYASGKFLSNILSFNDNFVPQICLTPSVKRWHSGVLCFDKIETFDHLILKEHKIQEIFNTIPPTRDEWLNWHEYELGCSMFWGSWGSNFNLKDVYTPAINILEQNYCCFLMCHSFKDLEKYKLLFPNAQIIQIVNDKKIVTKNLMIKSLYQQPNNEMHSDESLLQFDIDTVFDKFVFFEEVNLLMKKLNISNRELDSRVYDYYCKYTSLY